MKDKLVGPVAAVILVVWTASAGYSFLSGQYIPLEVTTPVMLALSGSVFGIQISRNGGNNKHA